MDRLHHSGIVNCNTVKFYGNRKYEVLIPALGSVHYLHAGFGEVTHKRFKAAYNFTNRHTAVAVDQVSFLLALQPLTPPKTLAGNVLSKFFLHSHKWVHARISLGLNN